MACGEIQFTKLLGKTTQEIRRAKLIIDMVKAHQLEEATYTLKEETKNGKNGCIYLESFFNLVSI